MTNQIFHRPDAMPLREALRGLRFFLRRGGETFAETLDRDALPKPASELAGVALRKAEGFARSVDEIASDLAKTFLGATAGPAAPLQDLIGKPDANAEFAIAIYVALSTVLQHLGATTVLVSEAAARSAFEDLVTLQPGITVEDKAARLTLSLLDARVVRGVTIYQAALVPGAALEAISVFAVMLWLQAARPDAENEDALTAATDMAVALASEISTAVSANNATQIALLYKKYVAHV